MKVIFEKIKIHGFLSFGDSELSLKSQGYVLVSGVNNNPKDSALSNGSGKSSIWSAICWALTGETIQGLSSNICNINIDDGCFVELDFSIDSTSYKIIRYRNYSKIGTDLKIFINGEDKSGKGIRESQKLLEQYIPDLTSQLIGSVIILGQGLPHKFSNNTPSGRKEMLEKLSKSDFMIQDIKDRLSNRKDYLLTQLRSHEDNILETSTKINIYKNQLEQNKQMLSVLSIPVDFDFQINQKQAELNSLNIECEELNTKINNCTYDSNKANELILELSRNKDIKIENIRKEFDDLKSARYSEKNTVDVEIGKLSSEIRRLKNIQDICPTCGQKLPNIVKPDTTEQEQKLEALYQLSAQIKSNLDNIQEEYNKNLRLITDEFTTARQDYDKVIYDVKIKLSNLNNDLSLKNNKKLILSNEINKLILDKENYLRNKKTVEDKIIELENTLKSLDDKILYINKEKILLEERISVVDKMSTLVKRDFRGFLLTNVIQFIDKKAKEYCLDVFGTDEFNFKLDGNNIEIEYSNKAYENLSGGEKQKCDLILQFSIRDMLCQYLGFSANILVLDEITDNLDTIGCNKILNLISNKLTDIESIFIISHHSFDLAIPYDYEIVVEKDVNGISRIR